MSLLCKKCLIGVQADDYIRMIEKSKEAIPAKQRCDEATLARRIAVCEDCDRFYAATCRACGCYVELRALKKDVHCPYKKW